MKWYVLRVASNKEMHVRDVLTNKVKAAGVTNVIGRIEVPVERIKRVRGNKQTVHKRKLYPGYIFMEMETDPQGKVPQSAWFIIKEIPGVGDFVGTEGIPTAMRDTDVAKMMQEVEKPEEAPSIKVDFKKGDQIKIREGPFESFEGTVEAIDQDRGIVKVIVEIFGRSTPLDIEYWQIEKV
jgi:transcriptional antiterminator NusG